MVSGHSYLPNDADFGSIETYSKDKQIYVPEDWFLVVARCRKKRLSTLQKWLGKSLKTSLILLE